ncbi:hypothetical protein CCR75_002986 [Bremia lactucae]|uniref:Uncharacterized protein n=1 Tax=Bremia lactucae TaxID=4779 RepID=A0A976FFJ4_BRELC|nr:hypothetical protein CCR75_002986 [Bremia lactucae]
MAEKDRPRSRATIAHLLSSHVRQERGIPRAAPAPPPASKPAEVGPPDQIRVDMPPPRTPIAVGQPSRYLDVTMAESTVTFGNTMRMGDLDGGSVTPPACAASVHIPEELP